MVSARRFGIGRRIIYNIGGKVMRESLENVKVGDEVIEISRWVRKIAKVQKVTKTQIMVSEYGRYRRKDGILVGSCNDLWPRSIRLPKEGEIEEMKRLAIVIDVLSKVRMMSDKDITYEQAVKIKEVLGL